MHPTVAAQRITYRNDLSLGSDQAVLSRSGWVENLHGCPLSARVEGESDFVLIIQSTTQKYIVVHLYTSKHPYTDVCTLPYHTHPHKTIVTNQWNRSEHTEECYYYHAQWNTASSKYMLSEHLLGSINVIDKA